MPRTSLRPAVALALVAALLGYVGCSKTGSPGPGPGASPTGASAKADPKAPPPPKLFADWPAPAGALVISGEQFGYLEPCGCTEGQQGGLLRRYEMVRGLREQKKWPLALVDLGSLIKDPAQARGGPEQTKLKFHAALQALGVLDYDALALSPEDLKLGVDEAVGQFLNLPGDKLKVVAANVTAAGLESKIVPSLRATAGPVKLGITAVVDPERLKALRDPSLDLLAAKPIAETLPAVLADLEKDTAAQVLLVQGPPELAKSLAAEYPGFDLVVGTSDQPDPPDDAERLNGGKTLLIQVGHKGKYAGVVGLYPGGVPTFRYQRVALNTEYDGPAGPMKAVIEGEFRESLKGQKVVENFPRHGYVNGAPGAKFAGADSCKTCHPNTYARWASTKHALAFVSLEKDPKPNVIYDAECVACHTTGFEYDSGWKSPEATAFLKGNQCENCHGPASTHVADPGNAEIRSALHLTAAGADKNRLCIRCHDEDNSPHFKFETHWPRVVHTGLDKPQAPGKPAAP